MNLQSLGHSLMLVLKHQKQKQEERRESMTDKEIDAMMRESMSKVGPRIEVDSLGIDLKWTSEEDRVVSLKDGRIWDLYDLLCFVWAHFFQHSRKMDDDTKKVVSNQKAGATFKKWKPDYLHDEFEL